MESPTDKTHALPSTLAVTEPQLTVALAEFYSFHRHLSHLDNAGLTDDLLAFHTDSDSDDESNDEPGVERRSPMEWLPPPFHNLAEGLTFRGGGSVSQSLRDSAPMSIQDTVKYYDRMVLSARRHRAAENTRAQAVAAQRAAVEAAVAAVRLASVAAQDRVVAQLEDASCCGDPRLTHFCSRGWEHCPLAAHQMARESLGLPCRRPERCPTHYRMLAAACRLCERRSRLDTLITMANRLWSRSTVTQLYARWRR